jgi:hypothetical protein
VCATCLVDFDTNQSMSVIDMSPAVHAFHMSVRLTSWHGHFILSFVSQAFTTYIYFLMSTTFQGLNQSHTAH